jgi:hypothetical protein
VTGVLVAAFTIHTAAQIVRRASHHYPNAVLMWPNGTADGPVRSRGTVDDMEIGLSAMRPSWPELHDGAKGALLVASLRREVQSSC